MVWQETPLPPGVRLDAEQERELRLISQARAGADWALAALVARYQPMVVRYLVRLVGDPERARQLAEKVFLRMERRLRGPHGGEFLRLWLLRASTEAGLDALRHVKRGSQVLGLVAPGLSSRLLSERVGVSTQRLREGFGKLAEKTSATGRQVRQLIWATDDEPEPRTHKWGAGADERQTAETVPPEEGAEDPRSTLRHRMVRAVLAEIAYGDAQCLALHLVAGLNQAEVARALGIRASAARHHIVLGLEMFSQRYEAALAELGIPPELAYADIERPAEAERPRLPEREQSQPAPRTIEATVTPLSVESAAASEADVAGDLPNEVAAHTMAADSMAADSMAADEDEARADVASVASAEEHGERTETADVVVAATALGAAVVAEQSAEADATDKTSDMAGGGDQGTDTALQQRNNGGARASDEDDGQPPFLVEPPLWQSPELADGALLSSAGAVPSAHVATLVAETPGGATARMATPREETLAAVAGVLTGASITAPLVAPPIGPIIETTALAASPEHTGLIAHDAPQPGEMALVYEAVEMPSMPPMPSMPSMPLRTPVAIVPVVSPDARPMIVPLLSEGAQSGPAAVPVLTTDEVGPPREPPRLVPVRTPNTPNA